MYTKQVISIDFPSIAFILLCKISIPLYLSFNSNWNGAKYCYEMEKRDFPSIFFSLSFFRQLIFFSYLFLFSLDIFLHLPGAWVWRTNIMYFLWKNSHHQHFSENPHIFRFLNVYMEIFRCSFLIPCDENYFMIFFCTSLKYFSGTLQGIPEGWGKNFSGRHWRLTLDTLFNTSLLLGYVFCHSFISFPLTVHCKICFNSFA